MVDNWCAVNFVNAARYTRILGLVREHKFGGWVWNSPYANIMVLVYIFSS